MSNTKIIDIIENLFAQTYESDDEIPTDVLDELVFACEVELRERDE